VVLFAPNPVASRSPRYDRLTRTMPPAARRGRVDPGADGARLHDAEAWSGCTGRRPGRDDGPCSSGPLVVGPLGAPRSSPCATGRAPALALQGDNVFFGPGSDCLNVLDHRTGERRLARLADVRDGLTLLDALPNMDFGMSMFLPSDVDPAMADRRQMALMLERTTKPLVVVTYDVEAMLDAIAMAEATAGGADALRERPNVALYVNVTRGLVQNGDCLRKLLILAERGLPAIWVP